VDDTDDDDENCTKPSSKGKNKMKVPKPQAIWIHPATLSLMNTMEELLPKIDEGMQKKVAYETASQKLKKDINFTADFVQCNGKWDSLVDMYKKRIEAINGTNSTGKGTLKPWLYHDVSIHLQSENTVTTVTTIIKLCIIAYLFLIVSA
jgi:hypothetical protein